MWPHKYGEDTGCSPVLGGWTTTLGEFQRFAYGGHSEFRVGIENRTLTATTSGSTTSKQPELRTAGLNSIAVLMTEISTELHGRTYVWLIRAISGTLGAPPSSRNTQPLQHPRRSSNISAGPQPMAGSIKKQNLADTGCPSFSGPSGPDRRAIPLGFGCQPVVPGRRA